MPESLAILWWVGEDDFMASNQAQDRTSSSIPGFFLGIVRKSDEEKAVPLAEYGNRPVWIPNIDSFIGAGSARTGDVWFDFRSIYICFFFVCKIQIKRTSKYYVKLSGSCQQKSIPIQKFGIFSTNYFVNEKPLLKCYFVTAGWSAVHQLEESLKLKKMHEDSKPASSERSIYQNIQLLLSNLIN